MCNRCAISSNLPQLPMQLKIPLINFFKQKNLNWSFRVIILKLGMSFLDLEIVFYVSELTILNS